MATAHEQITELLNAEVEENKFVYLDLRNRRRSFAKSTILVKGYVPAEGSLMAGILAGVKFITIDDRTAEEQARLYDNYGDRLHATLRAMDNSLRRFRQGGLVRFILDVESGALYYRKMLGHFWLFGVVVNQYYTSGEGGVDEGDVKLGALVTQVESILRRAGH
jgi:hypothetical protein